MSAKYRILVSRRAKQALQKLQRRDQQRINAAITLLADDPRPPKCVALSGEKSVYRVRVGDFRIIYEVRDSVLIIHVMTLGHRRDVYR